jgi:hypothetical protein
VRLDYFYCLSEVRSLLLNVARSVMLHVLSNLLRILETFGLTLPISTLIIAYCYPCFVFRGTLFEYGLRLVIPGVCGVLCGLLSRSCRVLN